MKVTIVPIVIGAFGIITKGLLKGLEDLEVGGRVETIKMTALLRTARNPEMSPGDLRRLADTQTPVKKPSANTMAMKGYTLFSKAPPLLAAHHLI